MTKSSWATQIIFCLTALAVIMLPSSLSFGAPSRFVLADQSDYSGNKGFYIDVENDTGSAPKSEISNLKLFAGIANGKSWTYIPSSVQFQIGHPYSVVLSVDSGQANLSINGVNQGSQIVAMSPADTAVTGEYIPGWANAPTDYFVTESSIRIDQPTHLDTNLDASSAVGTLFNPTSAGLSSKWNYAGGNFTVAIKFEILAGLPATSGLIDQFGQPTFANYPGKIHSDSDLLQERQIEFTKNKLWMKDSLLDQWGGSPNHKMGRATGFYHLIKHNGFSWLIDPSGNPCFYIGVDTASIPYWEGTPITGRESMFTWLPTSDPKFASAVSENNWGSDPGIQYVSFTDANMIRKYGKANWAANGLVMRTSRLKAWGLSGLGKWCEISTSIPNLPVLGWNGVANLIRRPDFFDPAIAAQMVSALKQQISPFVGDPYVVGWSLGNEYDEVITTDEIKQILALPSTNPSHAALNTYAATWNTPISNPPSADDLEKLRHFYADRYYAFTENSIKSIDHNHLFFGFWLAVNWWQNPSDWILEQGHVDAMGIDIYSQHVSDALLPLLKQLSVPVIIGEYGFPPDYSGSRGFGTYGDASRTDAETGALYKQWIHDTAANPNVIGTCLFQMYDEPITGRGSGHGDALVYGENYAFGFVRDTDTPKWDMLEDVRAGNLMADKWRLGASGK